MGNGEEGFPDFLLLLKSMSLRLHLIWKRYIAGFTEPETRFFQETGLTKVKHKIFLGLFFLQIYSAVLRSRQLPRSLLILKWD